MDKVERRGDIVVVVVVVVFAFFLGVGTVRRCQGYKERKPHTHTTKHTAHTHNNTTPHTGRNCREKEEDYTTGPGSLAPSDPSDHLTTNRFRNRKHSRQTHTHTNTQNSLSLSLSLPPKEKTRGSVVPKEKLRENTFVFCWHDLSLPRSGQKTFSGR